MNKIEKLLISDNNKYGIIIIHNPHVLLGMPLAEYIDEMQVQNGIEMSTHRRNKILQLNCCYRVSIIYGEQELHWDIDKAIELLYKKSPRNIA